MAILENDFLRAHKLSVNPAAGLSLSTISSSSGATASAIRPELAIVPTAVTLFMARQPRPQLVSGHASDKQADSASPSFF
jgi:hypothetical protein